MIERDSEVGDGESWACGDIEAGGGGLENQMSIKFRCTCTDFIPQKGCEPRYVTMKEWRASGKRWGLYRDWGPQISDIGTLEAKSFKLFVLFDGSDAIACAGRLPRRPEGEEIDSVWDTYMSAIDEQIKQKEFDLLLLTPVRSALKLLERDNQYYYYTGSYKLCLFSSIQCWEVQVWKPRE